MNSNEAKGLPRKAQMLKSIDDLLGGNSRYEGDRQGGEPHGKGTLLFDDVKLESIWNKGKQADRCKITFPDGFVYEGIFPKGQGTIREPNGVRYDGEVNCLMKHGEGTITFPDGSKYKGKWLNDFLHGPGTLFNDDGIKVDVEYSNGEMIGGNSISDFHGSV